MSLMKVDDGGGNFMTLIDVGKYRLCKFAHTAQELKINVDEVRKMRFRSDDVLLCTPPKSGTHWTWEILSMLVQGMAKYMEGSKGEKMLEARPPEVFDVIPSPRVLNTHLHYNMLPVTAIKQNVKVVFVVRNPKDMVVSWYHHCKGIKLYEYEGQFENFLNLFYNDQLDYTDYFSYLLEWEQAIKQHPDLIHLAYYEDMQEDPVGEVKRFAEFLGISGDQALYEEVARTCSFGEMAKNKEYSDEMRQHVFVDNFSMFRKGKVGGWKDTFTVAQNEKFDRVWADRMKESTLKFRYTL